MFESIGGVWLSVHQCWPCCSTLFVYVGVVDVGTGLLNWYARVRACEGVLMRKGGGANEKTTPSGIVCVCQGNERKKQRRDGGDVWVN